MQKYEIVFIIDKCLINSLKQTCFKSKNYLKTFFEQFFIEILIVWKFYLNFSIVFFHHLGKVIILHWCQL